MDANKFMTEYQRMCASYTGCRDCPLYTDNEQCTEIPSCFTKEFTDKVIKIVEDWSAAHPRKTRQDVFLEQYPEAGTDTKVYTNMWNMWEIKDIPQKDKESE